MSTKLIADSGSTKCEWCLVLDGKKKKTVITQGISPYFLSEQQILSLLHTDLLPSLKKFEIDEVHYYGTGLGIQPHVDLLKKVLKKAFPKSKITANNDLLVS